MTELIWEAEGVFIWITCIQWKALTTALCLVLLSMVIWPVELLGSVILLEVGRLNKRAVSSSCASQCIIIILMSQFSQKMADISRSLP